MRIISPGLGPGVVRPIHWAFSGCCVSNTTNQNVNNAAETFMLFDTEHYDAGGWHSVVTNTGRLTVPSGISRVVISAVMYYSVAAAGSRVITLKKNGADLTAPGVSVVGVGNAAIQTSLVLVSPALPVVAGDYFEIACWQDSGGALTCAGAGSEFTIEGVA